MSVRANWQVTCAGVALLFAAGLAAAAPPGGVYDVTAHGALGDGAALDTAAIQGAIDACAAAGGGVVSFPPGAYLTGTVYLKSGVHLRVEQGATVLGSTNLADYPVNTCAHASRSDEYTVRALVWGEGLEDVGITGAGVLDGQGAAFRGKTATDAEGKEASRALTAAGRYPVHPRYAVRPYLIRLISCRNVLVEGVTMRNSAMWMQHYLDCDFLTVRGITVWNHVSGNNDMIDLDGCRNVVVSDCVGDSDDDALTLKSTGPRATEHVVVTNCILRSHCNAVKMGTESAGGFRDIAISNCVIQRSQSRPSEGEQLSGRVDGISGISLELVDGGVLERVSISNIVIEGTAAPLFMRLGNRGKTPKPGDPKPAPGVMRDIAVSNIVATGAGVVGCAVSGIPGHCIENVSLSNISIRFQGGGKTRPLADVPELEEKYPEAFMFGDLPAYGLFFRHVRGLTVRDVRLGFDAADPRPAIVCDDVEGMRLDGLQARAVPGAATQVLLRDTRDLLVTGCVADAAEAFLAETGGCADIRLMNNDTGRAGKERVKAR
ncbi:MAG: glycoside hydrolase family 28 protein [Candidatus Hydrogenedentes bacterium]|nr:glycoside hydrolase family 28 protein [Candidatus Hydrogenedentota bacterium]